MFLDVSPSQYKDFTFHNLQIFYQLILSFRW